MMGVEVRVVELEHLATSTAAALARAVFTPAAAFFGLRLGLNVKKKKTDKWHFLALIGRSQCAALLICLDQTRANERITSIRPKAGC